jgi:hypothetical protein
MTIEQVLARINLFASYDLIQPRLEAAPTDSSVLVGAASSREAVG